MAIIGRNMGIFICFLRPMIVFYYFHNLILEDKSCIWFVYPQNYYLEDILQEGTCTNFIKKISSLLFHENINLDSDGKGAKTQSRS